VPTLGARRSVLCSLLGRAHRRAPPAAAQLRARTAEFVRDIERVWGVEFPPGRNPDLIFMAHLWEPLRVLPKPLALHLASEAAGLACHALLAGLGFRRRSSQARAHTLPCGAPGRRAGRLGMHAFACTRVCLCMACTPFCAHVSNCFHMPSHASTALCTQPGGACAKLHSCFALEDVSTMPLGPVSGARAEESRPGSGS